jgi:hypothetical protein
MDFILLLFTNRYWVLQPKLSQLLMSKLLRSCGLKVRLAQRNWLFVCTQFSFKVAVSFVINTKAWLFVSCHFRRMCCNIIWHRTSKLVKSIPVWSSRNGQVIWLSVVMILFSFSEKEDWDSISKQEHDRFLPRYLLFIIHTVRIIRYTERMQMKKQTIISSV